MKLNARQVETAKPKDKTYKMADGGGLYLEVSAKGSKYWRMKYRRPSDKKEDRLAFGVWPTVTLAQARAKRDEAKKLLVQGIDPKAEQKETQAENSGAYTFETIAREWHSSNKRWSEDHRSRVLRYLELYIFPHIGSSDIRQLKTSHLLAPIKKVDASGKHDVAQRLQQRVTAIMRYAVQNDYIDSNPASDIAGALSTTEGEWSFNAEESEVADSEENKNADQHQATSRWRKFSREWIRTAKSDSLDISWLKDKDSIDADSLPEPDVLAAEAMGELVQALGELDALMRELGADEEADKQRQLGFVE